MITPTNPLGATEARTPASPEKYHADNHFGEFADCWRCGRARAKCRAKRAYGSWQEADVAQREVNERERFSEPVCRYRCRWCLRWHLTHASTKQQTRRSEKQRRKWLVAAQEVTHGTN